MDLSLVDALDDDASFFADTDDVHGVRLDASLVVTPSTPCAEPDSDARSPVPDHDPTDALLTDPFDASDIATLPSAVDATLHTSPAPHPARCITPPPPSPPLHHSHFAHPHAHAPLLSHPSSPLQENVPAGHLSAHTVKAEQFEDDIFGDCVIDVDVAGCGAGLGGDGRMDDEYLSANLASVATGTTRPVAKDKLAQRKQRNKESARRYREKQVARRRHLENYTRTLCEQNRELETLHDRLLSLTCERSFAMDGRGPHGGDPARAMYGYGVQPVYSATHATTAASAYHAHVNAALDARAAAVHGRSQPVYGGGRSRLRGHHRSQSSGHVHVPSEVGAHHAAYLSTLESPTVSHNMHSTLLNQRGDAHDQGILLPGSVHMQARGQQGASHAESSVYYGRAAVYVHASTQDFDQRSRTRALTPSLSPSERHFATSGRL